MTCRVLASPPAAASEARIRDLVLACPDLLRHERKEEFRWLARASGVPAEAVERLWRRLADLPRP
ncbi:MAG TPA: hypothetical protein VLI67_06990 [Vicinamibacteria bacterium]|nr:hypothetical protein [Vicinamibacteria bacterium]